MGGNTLGQGEGAMLAKSITSTELAMDGLEANCHHLLINTMVIELKVIKTIGGLLMDTLGSGRSIERRRRGFSPQKVDDVIVGNLY